jgi:Tfp pilus assembly protein PilN
MRAVNLLPRDEQRERLQSARTSLFVAGGGVIVATALAMFLASSAGRDASDSRAELQAVETEIANLPKVADAVVTHGTIVRERSDRVAALSAALSTRVPFDRLLREISFVLPGDAWLTQLDATAPVSSVPAAAGAAPPPPTSTAPAGVSIEGATYSHDSVARVLARLSVVPSLENVRLTSSARVEPQRESPSGEGAAESQGPGKPFVTFIVTASLRTGATP